MTSSTFGLFIRVSDSGLYGPLVHTIGQMYFLMFGAGFLYFDHFK